MPASLSLVKTKKVTVHLINHRCHVNSEPVYVEPAPEATVGLFQGMALQESFSRTQDFSSGLGVFTAHRKINDMSYNQLISDSSTYVK